MTASAKAGIVRLGLLLCAAAAVLALPSAASADTLICGPGSGAGQCSSPQGVAVDASAGLLYVADWGNKRVDVFDAASGAFDFAFGWKVNAAGPEEKLQVCTAACQAGSSGTGAGQFTTPIGIAVDNDPASPSFHDVYVADQRGSFTVSEQNYRVQKFDPEGHFLLMFGREVDKGPNHPGDLCTAAYLAAGDTCGAGLQGKGEGQFSEIAGIAVGPAGIAYVADSPRIGIAESEGFANRVEEFDTSGAFVKQVGPLSPTGAGNSRLGGLAVESGGDFYASDHRSIGAVRKYDPTGALLNTFNSSFNIAGLATDASDDVFVADQQGGYGSNPLAIFTYNPSAAPLRVLYGEEPHRFTSLAPYSSSELFGVDQNQGVVAIPLAPASGPLVPPGTTAASPVASAAATLNAEVNPEGKATTAHFQYITKTQFQADGESFGAGTVNLAESAALGSDFALHEASFAICPEPLTELPEGKCLTPETAYYFRAVPTDSESHTNPGPKTEFRTGEPIEFKELWSTGVGAEAASVHTALLPNGIPTEGHFEYVDDATYEADIAASGPGHGFDHAKRAPEAPAQLDFGAGEAKVSRGATLGSLAPATVYHYRPIATDAFGSFAGPATTFTTFPASLEAKLDCPNQAFRIGLSATLPDCRAYEMVSPLDKGGGEIRALQGTDFSRPAEVNQSAASVPAQGPGLTYSSYRAFGDAATAPFTSQYIASRGPDGWSSHGISPPREGPSFYQTLGLETQYTAFSADLGQGWLRSDSEPPLSEGAIPGYPNLYRRDNAAESYEAICPVKPPHQKSSEYYPVWLGGSADGAMAVFRVNDKLTAEAASAVAGIDEKSIEQLYGCEGGGLRLISVLPGGGANPGSSSLGTHPFFSVDLPRDDSLHNAVAADGRRVYWTADGESFGGPGKIYLRENPMREQSAFLHGAATGAGNLFANSKTVSGLIAAAGKATLTAGSKEVAVTELTTGKFVAGQPIAAAGIPSGVTIAAVSGSALTLSAAVEAGKSGTNVAISSKGPAPFAVGQAIAGPGIPIGATIAAVALGSLTLSANATENRTKAPLSATSPCSEPEKACTMAVSEAVGAAGNDQGAEFWTASTDGSRAIFSFSQGPLAGKLYEFDAETGTASLIAEGVSSLAGWSEDARRLYLISTKALAAGAVAGELNLYLHEAGEGGGFALVASFPKGVGLGTGICSIGTSGPYSRCTRATPDGSRLAFMSNARFTGYDNLDEASGQPDAEVYLYDSTANGGAGQLRCVSCNPSGARPGGRLVEIFGTSAHGWIAAQIPNWANSFYAPRALSDDGQRLFFESFDPLVGGDTNGTEDVYEWEGASGPEDCRERGAGLYSPAAGGCLSLISSGKSREDSEFLDASTDGSDVFFKTAESILPQDPGLIDVYDARVEGGFPAQPSTAPACEGEACQGALEAPNDPTPASSAFQGAGNVPAEAPATSPPCAKGKVRRHGKCVAKKHHKRARRRANRNGRAGR